jgi:hypothetical protein
MRVAAQGLTIVALVAGTWSLRPKDTESPSGDATATRNDVDVERRRLEKIAKEKEEFEVRLKGAERAEGIEAELRARRRSGAEPAQAGSVVRPTSGAPATSEQRSGSRWWGWFGGRGGPCSGAGGSSNET